MAVALQTALAQVLSIFLDVLHVFGRVIFMLELDVAFEVELDTEALSTFFTEERLETFLSHRRERNICLN